VLEPRAIYTTVHLVGAASAVSVALAIDAYLLAMIWRRRVVSTAGVTMIRAGSGVVRSAFLLLAVSGALLVLDDPTRYLGSGKFLAKMTVVLVIAGNGAFIHRYALPCLARLEGVRLADAVALGARRTLLFGSAAVSTASWVAALVLGLSGSTDLTYAELMLGYLVVLAAAVCAAQVVGGRVGRWALTVRFPEHGSHGVVGRARAATLRGPPRR